MSPTNLLPHGHPDRFESVEEVFEAEYHYLVSKMRLAGIEEGEAALAIESLAQTHLDAIAASANIDAELDQMREDLELPLVSRQLAESDRRALEARNSKLAGVPEAPSRWPWVFAGGALMALAIGFAGIFP